MVDITRFVNFMQRFFFEQLRIQAKIDPDQYAPLVYKDAQVVTADYLSTEQDEKQQYQPEQDAGKHQVLFENLDYETIAIQDNGILKCTKGQIINKKFTYLNSTAN